jgi:hypothetical protein
MADLHVVITSLPAAPACPLCGFPGKVEYRWGPFSQSNIRVRTLRQAGRLVRLLKCCRCLRHYGLRLESPGGDE